MPFTVAVTVPQPLAQVQLRPQAVLKTDGPGYWTPDQIWFNASESAPLLFGAGGPGDGERTRHMEVTVREGGRACPAAPCRAAFTFNVRGKHKVGWCKLKRVGTRVESAWFSALEIKM